MARLKKALDGRDSHILTLRILIGILAIALLYSIAGWKAAPEHIKIDIPPDLRSGSTRGIQERHPFNVYAFGYYIFQQMNNWPVEGIEDYKKQINRLSCYITPRFKGELERDYEQRLKRHELNRTRALQEMPDRPYTDKRVYVESGDSWVAFYDVNIKETFRSEIVKDIFVRYPVRIVRWDVDPECNLWGLALDGFYKNPKRLEGNQQENENVQDTSGEVAGR
ncbi:MAG: TIGR03746 family integrating conjugative element protein [Oceanospirillaceae bacterium]|nr:TIGR03746 family integrating conjugative element protein [Oceanospirillaceae bacterium]|tara:strand:+ start:22221 stop:22889 length:669 start_codon:yes stop_codon:yes gene_type:complete